MPPRIKLLKHTATGTSSAMEGSQIHGWERSKLTNQDKKGLKKLGLVQKASLVFPGDESIPKPPMGYRVTFIDHLIRGLSVPIHEFLRGLLFVYGIQLHQLTPNSILHISIFVTLYGCFLRSHPHWGLWKRIFYLRRNNSCNAVYNVGGICICVRSDVDYFDVKFPDSVQRWRKKWLYIQDKTIGGQQYGIAPFDGAAEILRRKSWDAEATAEERAATDALMKRIHQLQNTQGKEISGVQITAYFLKIRVQPLQARKTPLWAYAGEEDVERQSEDLSTKDLEKLIRLFSLLSKKDEVPTSCRVVPYSASHALPENHQILSSLPPLPEGRQVDERTIINDESQESIHPQTEVVGSHKSAASSDKVTESDASDSVHSPPPAVSPTNKRKRSEIEDSGASKPAEPAVEETSPEDEDALDPYGGTGSVSSGEKEEEEELAVTGPAPTSTSNTVVLSEENLAVAASLQQAKECTEALEAKLKLTEEALEKAQDDASSIEELRQRLCKAETSLSDNLIEQIAREKDPVDRIEAESRRFFRRNGERFELLDPKNDRLLDALSILELQGDLARTNLDEFRVAFSCLFPHFFPKEAQPEMFSALVKCFLPEEDLALAYRRENLKRDVEGTIALVANSGQKVDWAKVGDSLKVNKDKWKALVKDAKAHSKKIIDFFNPKAAGSTSTSKIEVK
ncbi:hypothetical protein QYE76_046182 [Lolium multiflorum]|uniref:Transposase (putative) gypsy type domain-containing protein n=1 Tax=Lolium multiflorum TaxID=4521 RepID=A0AAD8TPD8_LOLMU|nr:hypothetical protein QYE76_046182 [Lolium multiflorum]